MGTTRSLLGLTQIRDATQYIRDRTFEGMNAGVDLWTLMGSISLPPELDIPQGHGKVPWLVRAIWEEYLGWFRYESTTELYDVPVGAIARDLIDLAGGTAPLLERAQAHLESGRPLEALHLLDIVLTESPNDALALSEKRTALGLLLERSGRENFSEVRWLEAEIREIEGSSAMTHPRLAVSEMCTYKSPFSDELQLWDELDIRLVGLLLMKVEVHGRDRARGGAARPVDDGDHHHYPQF